MGDTVKLEIIVNDKGSLVIKNFRDVVGKGMGEVAGQSQKAESSFSKLWKGMALGQAVFSAYSASLRAIRNGVKGLADEAMNFESEFANVTTLMDDADTVTEGMRDSVLDMAGSLGSATELTKGLYQALSASVDPAQAVEFVGKSAKFSRAALAGMYESVDVLTTVLNAYGLKASEVTDISDVLFQVIKDGKITGQQLAGSLGSVIPTAAAMGVNIREVGSAIAIMTQGGISADAAVTALNQTLLSALSPTREAEEVAKRYGIELSKAGIEGAGGLQKWLGILKEKLGDNTEAMSALFPNVRALKAALSLAGEQSGKYADEMERMAIVSGNTEVAFKKQEATLRAVWTAIKNEVTAALIKYLLPALKSVREWLESNRQEIGDFVKSLVSGMGTIVEVLGTVIGVLIDFKDEIVGVGLAFAFYFGPGAIATAIAGFGSLAASIGLIPTALGLAGLALKSFLTSAGVGIAALGVLAAQIYKLNNAIVGLGNAYDQEMGAMYRAAEGEKVLQEKFKATAAAAGLSRDEIQELTKKYSDIEAGGQRWVAMLKDLKKTHPEVIEKMRQQVQAAEDLKTATDPAIEAARKLAEQQIAAARAAEAQKKAAEELARQQKEHAAIVEKFGLNIAGLNDEGRELYFQLMQTVGILPRFTKETHEAAEQQARLGTDTGELTEEGRQMYFMLLQLVGILPELSDEAEQTSTSFEEMKATLDIISDAFNNISNAFAGFGIDVSGIIEPLQRGVSGISSMSAGFSKLSEIQKSGKSDFMGTVGALSSIAGGIGGVVSAGIGIIKFLGSLLPDAIANAIRAQNEWMKLNDKMIDQIKQTAIELAKESKAFGDLAKKSSVFARIIATDWDLVHAATSENLADIISQTEMTADTFDEWAQRTRDVLADFDRNMFDAAETVDVLGKAFTSLIAKAKDLGMEGSKSLTVMFEDLANRGLQVAEVQEYINAKLEAGADAYANLQDMIESSTVAQEVFGDISVPIFEEIIAYRKKLADNQDLVKSIQYATTMMTDLTDTQRISQDQFDQFTVSAGKSFAELIKGGMTSSEALKTMAPYLQRLQFLHEQYGYTIDANTQAILDQAIAENKVFENKQTETQQIIGLLGVIARQLGADIPDALGETADAATKAFTGAAAEAHRLNTELDNLSVGRNISINTKSQGDYVQADIGYYNPRLSQDTKFQAHKGEEVSIIPAGQNQGGGGRELKFYFYVSGEVTPMSVARSMNKALEGNLDGVTTRLEEVR